jgi:hypothetical protein
MGAFVWVRLSLPMHNTPCCMKHLTFSHQSKMKILKATLFRKHQAEVQCAGLKDKDVSLCMRTVGRVLYVAK